MINGERMSSSELDTTIAEILEKAGVTGLSVAIINHSEIMYQKGFGSRNRNTGLANNEETVFSAASAVGIPYIYPALI